MDDRDIGAGASAQKIEAAYRVANQAMLDVLLRAQDDPGEGRRALNEAIEQWRRMERLRGESGRLRALAREADDLGAGALELARVHLRRALAYGRARIPGAWTCVRSAGVQVGTAVTFHLQAQRLRAWSNVVHVGELILAWLRRRGQ